MSRQPPVDRVAEATARIYDALDSRLIKLDVSFDKFRDEMRTDIRGLETSTLNIDRSIQQMQGANLQKQVEENKATLTELEKRLRSVEDFKNNLLGRLIIIGAIAGIATAILGGVMVKLLSH